MKDRILQYLKENGSITTWEAFTKLRCTRLSEYIRQLRMEYNIKSEFKKATNIYGDKIHYSRYILEEK